jgi:uncharacterized membrane protein YbhN (UPF0104 family)
MNAPSGMFSGRLRRWLLPLLWAILTVALIVAVPRLPWESALREAQRVRWQWLAAACLANFAILPLWALEWTRLVPAAARATFGRMFGIVAVTASVLNSVPMLAGEVSAVAMLVARAGLSRGAALSVLAMDQLLVAFAKLLVLLGIAVLAPLPAWIRAGMLALGLAMLGMLALLLPRAHRWESLRGWLLRRGPARHYTTLARVVEWGSNLQVLREPRILVQVAALAIGKKGLELLGVLAIQVAFGLPPSLTLGLMVLGALALSTLIPIAPANLAIYEATVFTVYRLAGVPAESALGLALLQHVCFLLPSFLTGYVLLTVRQLVPRGRPAA